jgi:hypothetical protein
MIFVLVFQDFTLTLAVRPKLQKENTRHFTSSCLLFISILNGLISLSLSHMTGRDRTGQQGQTKTDNHGEIPKHTGNMDYSPLDHDSRRFLLS